MTPRPATHATVRVLSARHGEGLAFVAFGEDPETRVRWRTHPLRWRCDDHRHQSGCPHTTAVRFALPGHLPTEEHR